MMDETDTIKVSYIDMIDSQGIDEDGCHISSIVILTFLYIQMDV